MILFIVSYSYTASLPCETGSAHVYVFFVRFIWAIIQMRGLVSIHLLILGDHWIIPRITGDPGNTIFLCWLAFHSQVGPSRLYKGKQTYWVHCLDPFIGLFLEGKSSYQNNLSILHNPSRQLWCKPVTRMICPAFPSDHFQYVSVFSLALLAALSCLSIIQKRDTYYVCLTMALWQATTLCQLLFSHNSLRPVLPGTDQELVFTTYTICCLQ